jgi:hypothetical protein
LGRVKAQLGRDLAGRPVRSPAQLEDDAALREREAAAEQALLKHPDAAGIEAVEPAHGLDRLHRLGHVCVASRLDNCESQIN